MFFMYMCITNLPVHCESRTHSCDPMHMLGSLWLYTLWEQTINLTKHFWGFVWSTSLPWFWQGLQWKLHGKIANHCEIGLTGFIFWINLSVLGPNFLIISQLQPILCLRHLDGHQGSEHTMEMASCMKRESGVTPVAPRSSRHFRGIFQSHQWARPIDLGLSNGWVEEPWHVIYL